MHKSFVVVFLSLFFFISACTPKKIVKVEYKELPQNITQRPKNVVLLIGDGMGLAQIDLARIASQNKLHMQTAQQVGFIETSSSDNLITDSGAGGTAIACGVKTFNGAIGVDSDTQKVESILEKAIRKDLATGIVVSCALTHATPASFYAHQASRSMDKEIANDFYGKNIKVAMGGGMPFFEVDKLQKDGYTVISSYKDLKTVSNTEKVIAFYSNEKHPPSVLNGRGDWLPNATEYALNLLSTDSNGFFLMVEGSQIDWGGHDNNTEYMLSETIDFDKTLKKVLDFAAKDGNTLVLVTADHETGAVSILNHDPTDKQKYKATFSSQDHSAVMVPILAWGPGAYYFSGFMSNTDVAKKISVLLGM
jgi:alkaline phosphatase